MKLSGKIQLVISIGVLWHVLLVILFIVAEDLRRHRSFYETERYTAAVGYFGFMLLAIILFAVNYTMYVKNGLRPKSFAAPDDFLFGVGLVVSVIDVIVIVGPLLILVLMSIFGGTIS